MKLELGSTGLILLACHTLKADINVHISPPLFYTDMAKILFDPLITELTYDQEIEVKARTGLRITSRG